MIETSISKLLQGTQLQKFQNDIESKLKLFSIPQLRKFRNLRFALISIGMKECEVDEFTRMIDSQWRNTNNNNNNNNWSNNHIRRLEGISSQSKHVGRCCSSLPTSPCEDFLPLLTSRPYTYPSSFKPHPLSPSVNQSTQRGGGDDDDLDSRCEVLIHSPRCCCESCCNKRNEEYVVWYRADELKNKKYQSMTRPSEEQTADDVSKTLEIIYTKHPNKFVVPEGNAFDIRSYNPLKSPRDEHIHIIDSPQPSPSSPEKSPSKFGFKINWKNKSKTSQDPLNNQHKGNLSHKSSLIFRQKSQDDGKSKGSGSTPVDGSFFPSPFTKIQEALGKRKNKPSLRINVPKDENVYTNTNIKPMSANAERKMREALEEIAKLRNNNSPKSPAHKSTKDSPTKSSFSFKFPHIKGSSSKNKDKSSSSNSTGDQSPTISTSSSHSRGSSSSNNRTSQVTSKEDLIRLTSFNRLSSISSSSSQKSFGYDQVSKRCFKVKSRLSRRTTSECRPRAGSSSGMFTPYLAAKSRSVEFKVHKNQSPTNDSLVINQLAGNPLLRPQKSRNKRSVNEDTTTEFILRFNSTLTLQNESNISSPDKDNSAENSNSSSCTLKEEDFNASRKIMQKSRAVSPPPALPPRVPIKYKQSVPCLSYRESIRRKTSFAGSTRSNLKYPCHQACSMTLTRDSSQFSKYEKNPNVHPGVSGPLKSKHNPRVVISGLTATYKSYDHIPSHRPMVGSYPPDHRFSADASTFVRRIQSALSENDKNEDEFPISNSSSECGLDESNSYEDLMEQALDSKINDENDMQYIQDVGSKFNFTAPFNNKHLENCEWTIPEPRKHYTRGNTTVLLSPCQEKTVLVGHF